MADIAKCNNDKCNINEQCYRYTVTSNSYAQSYMIWDKEVKKEEDCQYFTKND